MNVRTLIVDRRIVAPALLLANLIAAIWVIVAAQADLDSMQAEIETKTALAERLSRTMPRPVGGDGADPARRAATPFVTAETETLAAAEVDRLVRAVTTEAAGAVLSSQAEVARESDAPMRRIEVQAIIEGRIEALQRVLFTLETGAPLMFVDDVSVQPVERSEAKSEAAQMPVLQATLTLSAYWRSGP